MHIIVVLAHFPSEYFEVYIGQASLLQVVASQIHNGWYLFLASEHLGHKAPNHSQSTPCKQTCRGKTQIKHRIRVLEQKCKTLAWNVLRLSTTLKL